MNYQDEYKINEIVNILTEKLQSHSYMITRREAKNIIKLPIENCSDELEKNYGVFMKLTKKTFLLIFRSLLKKQQIP